MTYSDSSHPDPYESMTDDVFGEDLIEEIPVEEEFYESSKQYERTAQYHQSSSTHEDRQWAMWTHLSGLAGYIVPFGNIIAPLVLWLSKREEIPSIEKHAKDALNFQISITIWMIISAFLCIILVGIPILIGLVIAQLVLPIMAAIKVSKGEKFNYPWTKKFIK